MLCDHATGGVQGRIRVWELDQTTGLIVPKFSRRNTIMYEWGFAAAMALGMGDRSYRISAMYLEFQNVADPGDTVAVPAFAPDEGRSYYDDLSASVDTDYLRVALNGLPTLGIGEDYEAYFDDGETGNELTFMAQTAGTTGVHGKTFSAGVNSKVYGAALVATPVFADSTQDVVVARTYFDTSEQLVKSASKQVVVTWSLTFGL